MEAVHEDQLDPRIQVELEKLNTATDDINKLESKLEETNNVFSATFAESTARLKSMGKKLGTCIEKARPYYEALELARTSQLECQRAAVQYQRANALHQAAKETIASAEERFVNSRHENWQFDSAWQEMLNHATMKVMEAEAQKAASEREHMRRAAVFQQAEQRVQQLQRGLKSSINKSLVYFEEKGRVEAQLESQKERVQQLQMAITASKASYAQSLRRLEQISEQIHEQRRYQMPREPGVGAELTSPSIGETHQYSQTEKAFAPHADLTQEEKYWETLREKLEKLQASDNICPAVDSREASSSESLMDRERSVTGSSAGSERVVSGQSSSQESESDGGGSATEVAQAPGDDTVPEGMPVGSMTPNPDDGFSSEGQENKLPKGRSTPPGSCEKTSGEEDREHPALIPTEALMDVDMEGRSLVKYEEIAFLSDPLHNNTSNSPQDVMGKEDKVISGNSVTNIHVPKDMELDQEMEVVFEGNLSVREKEEGDGSSSPLPAPCRPSRGLTVIVEELEYCALPE